jgi:hypothetical protein
LTVPLQLPAVAGILKSYFNIRDHILSLSDHFKPPPPPTMHPPPETFTGFKNGENSVLHRINNFQSNIRQKLVKVMTWYM